LTEPFGAQRPNWLDRTVIAATSALPNNWLGLRLAIGLRRIVTSRLGEDGGLDVTRWGLRMRLHPRHNGCEKNLLFTPQMYEPPERRELAIAISRAQAAGRGFVFLDIGANVGLFSLFVAAQAGASARILAIEPEPENLRRLRFNLAANPGLPIQVIAVALDDRSGQVVIEVDRRDRGGSRTRPLAATEAEGAARVDCRPLIDVLQHEQLTHIDALKIDVEGAEDRVLAPFFRQAPTTLWPQLIIIEDTRGLWGEDLFAVLAEAGYTTRARTKLNVILERS
jgi:FkbM family methyltransferase